MPAKTLTERINSILRQAGITEPADVARLVAFAKKVQDDFAYFKIGSSEYMSVEAAVILRENRDETPNYKAAIKYKNGLIALITAVESSGAKILKENEKIDCLMLELTQPVEQRLFYFDLPFEEKGMTFPKAPESFKAYKMPSALSIHTDQYRTIPDNKAVNLFNINERQALDSYIFTHAHYPDWQAVKILKRGIMRAERERFHEAQRYFMQSLDPEILSTCRKTGVMNMKAYNWLAGGGNPARRNFRVQAANSYPLFFRELCEYNITEIIDSGAELKPVLAKHLGLNPHDADIQSGALKTANLQNLQNHFRPRTNRKHLPFGGKNDTWIRLNELPVQWWPQTPEDIGFYNKVVEAVKTYSNLTGVDSISILKGIKGEWQKTWEHLAGDAQYGMVGHDAAGIAEFRDFFTRLYQTLYLPVIMQEADREKTAVHNAWTKHPPAIHGQNLLSDLFNSQSMRKALDLSDRWHERLETVNARMDELRLIQGDNTVNLTWKPLTAPVTTPSGMQIVPLSCRDELAEEGREMGHCVGGYSARCHSGDSFIISIRSADGRRASTLHLKESNRTLSIAEHRGRHNAQVSGNAEEAARWYLNEIAVARIKPDWDGIHAQREKARIEADRSTVVSVIGFDPADAASCEMAYEIYRPFLPRAFRHLDYQGFLEKTAVRDKARILVQETKRAEKPAP